MRKIFIFMFVSFQVLALVDSTIEIQSDSSIWNDIKQRSSMSYFSVFTGPGITSLGSYQINSNGDEDTAAPINQWTQLSYRYRLDDRTSFILNPRFQYYYADREAGERMRPRSPLVGLTRNFQLTQKLKFSGMLATNLMNVEEDIREKGQILNPGGFQSLSYEVNNYLTTGLWFWFNAFIYQENSEDNTSYSLMFSPFVDYRLSDKGTFRFWIEQYYDDLPEKSWLNPVNSGLSTFVGYEYTLGPHLGIKPYLATNFSSETSTRATSIGAWIFGKVF